MVVWILYCIIDILFNIICYITNPFVLLFADDKGNLPVIFKWWANYDDCLDIDWMVYEHHVPAWAEYDYNRHYRFHDSWNNWVTTGIYCSYVDLLDPNFTVKERFQRYVCRLVWLYRNCAYGFSYHVTGKEVDMDKAAVIGSRPVRDDEYFFAHYKHWLTYQPFCYYLNKKWNTKNIPWLRWAGDHDFWIKLFFGWKFQFMQPHTKERVMLALFAWPFRPHD